jgi:uncharacterized protein (DUF1697 family)
MKYVALLRGINVGGNAKVEMPRLKQVFEKAGCQQVATYINSGNVIFADDRSAKEFVKLLEKAIADEFGLQVPVVLRDAEAIHKLCQEIPASYTNDTQQKTDVLFLWENIDKPEVIKQIVFKPEIERVRYVAGALVWNIDRVNATRGSTAKLVSNQLYKSMTIRNINTVRKLDALLAKLS